MHSFRLLGLTLLALISIACEDERPGPAPPTPAPATSASEPAAPPAKPHRPPPTREGGALVRAPDAPVLYLAHEDLDVVRRIELPFFASSKATEIPMPGPPASVLALDGRVLVTVRTDPGLLLILRPDEAAGLVETARVELPGDAWGLAVTADEQTALVTSAWTHQISAVDLQTGRKLWSRDVAREPRGVTITADGRAYVSHLTRATLTRVTDLRAEPEVTEVPFTAAPIRVVPGMEDRASLGYTAIPSPDGERLFFPRRALGAFGKEAWNGQATVDVMLLASETSLASRPEKVLNMWTGDFQRTTGQLFNTVPRDLTTTGPGPIQKQAPFIQPRAAIYRARTDTLLIASEGTDELVELDALAIDPSIKALRRYATGSYDTKTHTSTCAAPSGVALSEDEDTAYVFCRASHALRTIPLRRVGKEAAPEGERLALANDPLSEAGARGRQLFYNAHDSLLSDGFGCAGCHPEGRDDGHVWRQEPGSWSFMHAYSFSTEDELKRGMPRQTPMLAGRVAAGGPYGWKSESSSLRLRVVTGFSIHRWLGGSAGEQEGIDASKDLVVFLREGLRPPIRRERPLTAAEERGRAIFNSADTGCTDCHVPKTEHTNRRALTLGKWPIDPKRDEPEPDDDWAFRTPSLRYVGGTPPYYHDGSAPTLAALIDHNGSRMGVTTGLSPDDRRALVAYLETL